MPLPPNVDRLAEHFIRMNPNGWTERQARTYASDAYLENQSGLLSTTDLNAFRDAFIDTLRRIEPRLEN